LVLQRLLEQGPAPLIVMSANGKDAACLRLDEAAERGPDNRADDRPEDYVRPTSLPGRYKGHDQNRPADS